MLSAVIPTSIPLVRKDGTVAAYALVDTNDWPAVSRHTWHLHSRGYAVRRCNDETLLLHRVIMGLAAGDRRQVDHRNRKRLDCRRLNMRICTPAQNSQNRRGQGRTSKWRGVHWSTRHRRWVAKGMVADRECYLGEHRHELLAAAHAAAFRRRHMPYSTD